MRKFRNGLIFIMTVCLIFFCGMLPQIYAGVQDSVSDEKVEYEDIKTVLFEKELNLVEKLFLLRDGLRVSVSEENTGKTELEILEIVYGGVDCFLSNGMLFGAWENYACEVKIEPMLFFYGDSNHISSTFWLTELIQDDGREFLRFWVDDETGKILSVDYETEYDIYGEYQMEDIRNILHSYYLEQNELWDAVDIWEHMDASNEAVSGDYDDTKKYSTITAFTIGDEIYGELNLYFYVYTNGFSISLS